MASLLAVSIAGCGGDDGGATTDDGGGASADAKVDLSGQSVRIGTAALSPLDMGTTYAIQLLEDWGADVQHEQLTSISGLEAIVADQIDISGRSSDEVVDGNARGVPVVAFGSATSAMHYAMVGAPGIDDIAALEGKSIAVSGPGGFDTILITALLREEGLDPESDVTMVPIGGSSERTAAMLAGQADAAMVFISNWLSLQEVGAEVGLVGYVADMIPDLSSRTLAAKREYLDTKPDLALGVACANLEANQWINENREGFIEFTTEHVTGTTPEAVGAFYDEAITLGMFPTEPEKVLSAEAYQTTADLMFEGGLIDQEVDATEFVDPSYLQEAAEMGCGTD